MFQTLKKSKQLSFILMNRLGDYLALLRIEMKLQGREIGAQLVGYLLASVALFFALLFAGVATIVTFWYSDYRNMAAWIVVGLYLLIAAAGIALVRQHAGRADGMTTLREEIRRDMALIRENL